MSISVKREPSISLPSSVGPQSSHRGSKLLKTAPIFKPQDASSLIQSDFTFDEHFSAADKFLASEELYVHQGLRMIGDFERRLRNLAKLDRPILAQEEIQQIFLNASSLLDFHSRLYATLHAQRMTSGRALVASIGKEMVKFVPFFKLYQEYVIGGRKAVKALEMQMTKNAAFAKFVELEELTCNYSLGTLLSLPILRLPQYLGYLGGIHRSINPTSSFAEELEDAIIAIQKVADEIAQFCKITKAQAQVVTLQTKHFGGTVDLVQPKRYFVMKDTVRVLAGDGKKGAKEFTAILFNDMLMFATTGGTVSSAKAKRVVRLEGLELNQDVKVLGEENTFSVFDKLEPTSETIIVGCYSKQNFNKWVEEIEEHIVKSAYVPSPGQPELTESSADFERRIVKKKVKGDKVKRIVRTWNDLESKIYAKQQLNLRKYEKKPRDPAEYEYYDEDDVAVSGVWERHIDDRTGYYYYFNTQTQETLWEPPAEWDGDGFSSSRNGGGGVSTSIPTTTTTAVNPPLPPARPTGKAPPPLPSRGAIQSGPEAAGGHANEELSSSSLPIDDSSSSSSSSSSSEPAPPPPPPAPIFAPPPLAPPMSPDLLGGLQNVTLKPSANHDESGGGGGSNNSAGGGGGGGLMEQIMGGAAKLKKVDPTQKPPPQQTGGGGLQAALENSLKDYRKFVVTVEDDEEDDSEWD